MKPGKWMMTWMPAILMAFVFNLTACTEKGMSEGPSPIREVASMEAFREAVEASHAGLVMVDLYADWCPPCKELDPILDKIARANAARVTVYKLDVDRVRQVVRDYGIRGIPHVMFFRNGRLVHQLRGLQPASAYEKTVRRLS